MSEPKRYTDLQVWEALYFAGSTNGWIRWEDYARLKAEVERLTEGNECLNAFHDKEMERSAYLLEEFNRTTAWGRGLESDLSHARVEISFLKAEVERLRKAGDEVCEMPYLCENDPAVIAWRAAKEGKQP